MGEAGKDALRVGFDRSIKLEFRVAKVAIPRRLYRTILDRTRHFAAIKPRAAPI